MRSAVVVVVELAGAHDASSMLGFLIRLRLKQQRELPPNKTRQANDASLGNGIICHLLYHLFSKGSKRLAIKGSDGDV